MMGTLTGRVAFGGLVLAALWLSSCKKEPEVQAVPVDEYIKPDEAPTFTGPAGEKGTIPIFSDITESAGLVFEHVNGAFGQKWMPETIGAGGAFLDYNGDGWADILLINGAYWPGHEKEGPPPVSRLFENNGDGTFKDVTDVTGLSKLTCYGMGVAIADYDGDGDDDIYITAVGKNHLLRNDGGRFTDVTDQAKVGFSACMEGGPSPWEWSVSAVWLDYDRDGHLDLFVGNYVQWTPETDVWTTRDGKTKSYATPETYRGSTCVLFHNNGDGTFEDRTRQVGLFNPDGKSMSAVADDFNDDGWPDIVVTNDTQPNFLYINRADPQAPGFADQALLAGIAYDENGLTRAGMGVDVADLSNTGSLVIAIGNFSGEPVTLYTQVGGETFIDRAGASRLSRPTTVSLTFGLVFADFNLDGYQDLMLANGHIEPEIAAVKQEWSFAQKPQLFLNNRRNQMVDVTDRAGAPFGEAMVGRSLAVADVDHDGDLDVLITTNNGPAKLLRNDLDADHNVVRIRLQGSPYNRKGIGARLSARIGDQTQTRWIRTGGSYLGQSELVATFGLATAEEIEELEIRWPDGNKQVLKNLAANTVQMISQQDGVLNVQRLKR